MSYSFVYISFRTHMQDLQEVTHEVHYENFRSEKMSNGEGGVTKRQIKYARAAIYLLLDQNKMAAIF